MNRIESFTSKCFSKKKEILLIIPPFSILEYPCIGVDILYNIACAQNIGIDVFYANIAFADFIGVPKYEYISKKLMSLYNLIGERIFSKVAYSEKQIFGSNFNVYTDKYLDHLNEYFLKRTDLLTIAEQAIQWTNLISNEILKYDYKIIGITTGHQQTNSAIALINSIKNKDSTKIIVIGGSACDGEMAEGILSLSKNIDYVFKGESEISWKSFLTLYKKNKLPPKGVIEPVKLENLDEIVTSTYNYYFSQLKNINLKIENISLLYEGSRGCWWGEENKCNFCGVNGWNKNYRYKSEEKIISDFSKIFKEYPEVKIHMVDTLMPRKFLDTLLPILKHEFPQLKLFYEQRADLTLDQVIKLKVFGVNYTQVGIESLSSSILAKINKGIDAKTNINFLRYAKSVGCFIGWNFLYAIPNDTEEDWTEILNFLPYIYHLNPPFQLRQLEIARFSPYFNNAFDFHIFGLKPNQVYKDIFPENSNIEKLAWIFDSNYNSFSRSDKHFFEKLKTAVDKWIRKWNTCKDDIPNLKIINSQNNYYILDTRNQKKTEQISRKRAQILLYGFTEDTRDDDKQWALTNNYVYYFEREYIPLVTAHPKIFKELENE